MVVTLPRRWYECRQTSYSSPSSRDLRTVVTWIPRSSRSISRPKCAVSPVSRTSAATVRAAASTWMSSWSTRAAAHAACSSSSTACTATRVNTSDGTGRAAGRFRSRFVSASRTQAGLVTRLILCVPASSSRSTNDGPPRAAEKRMFASRKTSGLPRTPPGRSHIPRTAGSRELVGGQVGIPSELGDPLIGVQLDRGHYCWREDDGAAGEAHSENVASPQPELAPQVSRQRDGASSR